MTEDPIGNDKHGRNGLNSVLLQKYPISKDPIGNDKYDRNSLNTVLLQKYPW